MLARVAGCVAIALVGAWTEAWLLLDYLAIDLHDPIMYLLIPGIALGFFGAILLWVAFVNLILPRRPWTAEPPATSSVRSNSTPLSSGRAGPTRTSGQR